jgi:hypothetical protein
MMADAPWDAQERRILAKLEGLNKKLAELPSAAWAKEATNRKRAKLAAQKHNLEAALMTLRQLPLIPLIRRRGGENA